MEWWNNLLVIRHRSSAGQPLVLGNLGYSLDNEQRRTPVAVTMDDNASHTWIFHVPNVDNADSPLTSLLAPNQMIRYYNKVALQRAPRIHPDQGNKPSNWQLESSLLLAFGVAFFVVDTDKMICLFFCWHCLDRSGNGSRPGRHQFPTLLSGFLKPV